MSYSQTPGGWSVRSRTPVFGRAKTEPHHKAKSGDLTGFANRRSAHGLRRSSKKLCMRPSASSMDSRLDRLWLSFP